MDAAAFLLALVPIFVVVDPLACIGLYLGLTGRMDRRGRDRVALRATLFAGLVLVAFAVAGKGILSYLGIELYSLRVAGGILLVLIGLNMLKEGEEVSQEQIGRAELQVATGGVHTDAPVGHDPSLVPLGLPMLAGPGAITLVIVQGTDVRFSLWILVAAIATTMVASLLILAAANRAAHVIGENGRRVITRIMGLLTVAFAVQYVFDGVNAWLATR